MPIDPKFSILTVKDGSLIRDGQDTSPAVDALVSDLATAQRVAITIHGGLVDSTQALATAEKLLPLYQEAGIRPVFLIWESGLYTSISNLLRDVWSEKLFERLVKILLKHVAGHVAADVDVIAGGRDARGLPVLPPGIDVEREEEKRFSDQEPFAGVRPAPVVTEVTQDEKTRFETDLRTDSEFNQAAEEAARSVAQNGGTSGARIAVSQALDAPLPTLANPELFADNVPGRGARWGFFDIAKLVRHAAAVFVRIVSRFVQGRDHGVYATVVEEVLREFYGTNVGAAVWGTMKRQTSETFAGVGTAPPRGGWYFLKKLGELFAQGHRPEVSIVGHSAGGIYACNLLNYAASVRGTVLPADFRFKHALFLAPACSFNLFASVLDLNPAPFESCRVFALNDELESGYWELNYLYPRSLLYLVSGAFEHEAGGEGAFDLPLVGMQRYFDRANTYQQPEVQKVRHYLTQKPGRLFWSPSLDGEAGTLVDSKMHGQFFVGADGQPTRVMESVCHILQSG